MTVTVDHRAVEHLIQYCADWVDDIAKASHGGVSILFEGLSEFGRCLCEFGASRPASGYEHH